MRTAQELFNEVVTHLRKQNKQSLSVNGSCMYRGVDGLKCAIGYLIPDECYHDDMEGAFFGELPRYNHEARSFCPQVQPFPTALLQEFKDNEELLLELIHIHDDHTPLEWEERFEKLAEMLDLQLFPKELE
jgi:hypothetical protein